MNPLRGTLLQFALAVAVCASLAAPLHAGNKKTQAAQEFLKAANLTDIRSPGSPSFELDAKVDIRGNNGKFISGNYELVRLSPSKWREELTFSGYSRVRVGGKGRYWQFRSINYEPLQIKELSDALDFVPSLRNEKSPGKLKTRKKSGVILDCAESKSRLERRDYCFNPSEGVLVREKVPGPPMTEPAYFRYSDFQELGQRRFPDKIEVRMGRTPYADFSVQRLVTIANGTPADFVPPNGASLFLTCSNPRRPHLVKRVLPVYPEQEKRAYHQGAVMIYALIAADGSVQNARVLAAPSQALAGSALAAVRQWRYEPRRCEGAPTATETVIDVVFSLGRQ